MARSARDPTRATQSTRAVDQYDDVRSSVRRTVTIGENFPEELSNISFSKSDHPSDRFTDRSGGSAELFRDALRESAQLSDGDDDDQAWPSSRKGRRNFFTRKPSKGLGFMSLSFGQRERPDIPASKGAQAPSRASSSGRQNADLRDSRRGQSDFGPFSETDPFAFSRSSSLNMPMKRQSSLGRSFRKLHPRYRNSSKAEESPRRPNCLDENDARSSESNLLGSPNHEDRDQRDITQPRSSDVSEEQSKECRRLAARLATEKKARAEVLQNVASLQNALKNSRETCAAQSAALRRLEDQLVHANSQAPRMENGLSAAKDRFARREAQLIGVIARRMQGKAGDSRPDRSISSLPAQHQTSEAV